MAKKSAPKKTVTKDAGEESKTLPAKKSRKKATAKEPEEKREIIMCGETPITLVGENPSPQIGKGIGDLIEAVHQLGRVHVTSASHGKEMTALHVVLPDHPQPYDKYPGLVLTIDAESNLASFDHVEIGHASPKLVDDAAFSLLKAMQGEDAAQRNNIGRQENWFYLACEAADEVALRHVQA